MIELTLAEGGNRISLFVRSIESITDSLNGASIVCMTGGQVWVVQESYEWLIGHLREKELR